MQKLEAKTPSFLQKVHSLAHTHTHTHTRKLTKDFWQKKEELER